LATAQCMSKRALLHAHTAGLHLVWVLMEACSPGLSDGHHE
jgi:hypothetical protein